MVKLKIENETKEQKFKRIASLRTQRILDNLRLLGNCSNRGGYSYTEEDVQKIFQVLDKEIKRIRALFNRPYKNKFSL